MVVFHKGRGNSKNTCGGEELLIAPSYLPIWGFPIESEARVPDKGPEIVCGLSHLWLLLTASPICGLGRPGAGKRPSRRWQIRLQATVLLGGEVVCPRPRTQILKNADEVK